MTFPSLAKTEPICAKLEYDFSTNKYRMIDSPGCGGAVDHLVHTKLVSAEKNKDTIVLTQKIYMTSGGVAYKTLDAEDIIDESCALDCDNETYFDKGATTKYTFRLTEEGTYYFESKITE